MVYVLIGTYMMFFCEKKCQDSDTSDGCYSDKFCCDGVCVGHNTDCQRTCNGDDFDSHHDCHIDEMCCGNTGVCVDMLDWGEDCWKTEGGGTLLGIGIAATVAVFAVPILCC